MTHFKNFLSITALLAVVSFSSFGARAQMSCEVEDRTPDKEYLLADVEQTYADDLSSGLLVYNRAGLVQIMSFMNCFMPMALDEDFELTSFEMEGDELSINSTCDYNTALGLSMLDASTEEDLMYLLAAGIYEIFEAMGPDDNGDNLISRLDEMEITVKYNFYIDGIDTAVKTYSFTAEDLVRAGLINNNIYSI